MVERERDGEGERGGDGRQETGRQKKKMIHTWVGVSEERANRKKNLGGCEGRRPVILENIKTNRTLTVDVAVVDTGTEGHLRGLERIVLRELNLEEEDTSSIGGAFWPHDGTYPLIQVVTDGAGGAVTGGIECNLQSVKTSERGEEGGSVWDKRKTAEENSRWKKKARENQRLENSIPRRAPSGF